MSSEENRSAGSEEVRQKWGERSEVRERQIGGRRVIRGEERGKAGKGVQRGRVKVTN